MADAPGNPGPGSSPRRLAGGHRAGLAAGGCLLLLAAGCAASPSPAADSSQRPSGRAVPAQLSGAGIRPLAARYLAIARAANHRLEVEVDGYRARERNDLAAARWDLRAQAATERHFDAQLLQIRLPAPIADTARAMVRANQARIALTERQAQAASLASLRSLDRRRQAADAAVETWVRQIRVLLGLPPPSAS